MYNDMKDYFLSVSKYIYIGNRYNHINNYPYFLKIDSFYLIVFRAFHVYFFYNQQNITFQTYL